VLNSSRTKVVFLFQIRDAKWIDRLKEEYMALIKYIETNKKDDNDWVKIEAENKE
jgi:ufm1-conjugating enzyme 1